jgi:putative ATP-binding cassette transporter
MYLTHKLKTTWLTQARCLKLKKLTEIDNPEQRISDDLNLMPQLSLKIANNLCQAVITLIIFGSELWILSKQWGMYFHGHIVTIPGVYLWSTLVYAVFFNILVFTLGHRLIVLNYMNQRLNATFRCMMSLIREHSHEIVSQKTEIHHGKETDETFHGIVANAFAMLKVDRTIQFVRQISINSGGFFILAIALSAYFTYHLQLGYLMQVNGAALFFIKGLSVLIDAYEDIAQLRASVQRVGELVTSLDALDALAADGNTILLLTASNDQTPAFTGI